MEVEQREDGRWLVTGKTFGCREQLKALGGRWQAGEKAWLLPANVALGTLQDLALEAYEQLDDAARQRFQSRQHLLDTGDGAVHARDAKFTGETFACRDALKALGARWDGECWRLEGDFNKLALEQALDASGVEWHYYRPHGHYVHRHALHVSVEYDASRHAWLQRGCSCAPAYTCDSCRYACCAAAVPRSEEALAAERWVGVIYDCPAHGCVRFGTDD